jgi:hypothetical protein
MFKQTLIGAALLAVLAAGSAHAGNTTTGTPGNSDVNGYILDSNDWLDGQITLNGAQNITSIQSYLDDPFGAAGDNFNITLYSNSTGNKIGSELYTTTATYNGTTGWNGLSNLNWALAGGTYWIGLEVSSDEGSNFVATTGAPTLLANTAFSSNGGSSYSYRNIAGTGLNQDLNFGLSVTSVSAVPEADTWLMLLLGLGVVGYAASRRNAGKSFSAFA